MQHTIFCRSALITASFMLLASASKIFSGGLGCQKCGCPDECRKICRLECVDRKITTTCWGLNEDDFCLPGPSCPGCGHEEIVCDDCDAPGGPPWVPTIRFWREWSPSSRSKLFTRKKLMKKTMTKAVPGYKWVVEDLCPLCEADCELITPPQNALIPPPPAAVDAVLTGIPPQARVTK